MRQIENLAQKQRTQRVWDTYGTEITTFPEHRPYKEFIIRNTYLDFERFLAEFLKLGIS